nr:hypothetical protein CFP56_09965 [Quercus suber]
MNEIPAVPATAMPGVSFNQFQSDSTEANEERQEGFRIFYPPEKSSYIGTSVPASIESDSSIPSISRDRRLRYAHPDSRHSRSDGSVGKRKHFNLYVLPGSQVSSPHQGTSMHAVPCLVVEPQFNVLAIIDHHYLPYLAKHRSTDNLIILFLICSALKVPVRAVVRWKPISATRPP